MDNLERILQAIQNQRWFFFENNDKILFDRDTAFIWTNLSNFPYAKNYDTGVYNTTEVYILVNEINEQSFGGFSDWDIPTTNQLWKLVEDRTFPFLSGGNRKINNKWAWCVRHDGNLRTKDLDHEGAKAGLQKALCHVILCSASLKESSERYPSATEILDIFKKNDLIPIFKDGSINKLYKKLVFGLTEQDSVQNQIKKPIEESAQKIIMATFDYKPTLAKFNLPDLDKSPIKYFDAVLKVTDELLSVLNEYQSANSDTIAEFLKIGLNLNAKYIDNPNLTAEENKLLSERQKFLSERLELNTDEAQAQILSVKAQAEDFFARLNKINREANSIRLLAELQYEPCADFEFLVENLGRIITEAQRKVNFFVGHKDFVSNLVNLNSAWSGSYKAFKTSLREELAAVCHDNNVDDEIFAAWYDDWQTKRFAIEQRFLPPVEFALKGNFSDAVEGVLEILRKYRDEVDKFYLHERKNIYQKFAFQVGGDLQEKFETESELYKLAEKFQRDLQTIIFSRDNTEERIFLLHWSEPLLNLPIDEISNFIREKELDVISSEFLTQFAELRRKNFAMYLADSKAYSEAVQKREKDYNALIFSMRKGLLKK